MSFFATLLGISGAAQDAVYGESFLVEPRAKTDPNGRSAPDPTRVAKTITGIWSEPHADESPTNRTGHPAGEGAKFDDSKPTMDFETAALGYELSIGDFITRVATGVRYSISDPSDDGFTRTVVPLTSIRTS